MTSVKISALPEAGTIAGGELLPIVQNGETRRATASQIATLTGALLPDNNLSDVPNDELAAENLSVSFVVADLAALKALGSRPEAVIVETGQAKGMWQWEAGSSTTADDALVVQPTSGTAGRYKRIFEAGKVWASWFGAVGDGVTDSLAAIQAAVDCFSDDRGIVVLPVGIPVVSDQIELPSTTNSSVILEGVGKTSTLLRPTGSFTAGKALVFRGNTSVVNGGGIRNMTVDCNGLVDYGVYFKAGKNTIVESISVSNARVTEGLFGDASLDRFYQTKFIDCEFFTNTAVVAAGDRPDYNLRLMALASDNEVITAHCANATTANILVEGSGNTVIGAHVFGSSGTYEADYGIQFNGQSTAVDCYMDGFAVAGGYANSNDCGFIGCRFFWPSTTTGNGVLIADAKSRVTVIGGTYISKPAARVAVALASAAPADSQVYDGILRANSTKVLVGPTDSLAYLSSLRVQVAGTDFGGSGLSIGRFSADTGGGVLDLFKSRGTTIGGAGVVASADSLGTITFAGDDGSVRRDAARITVSVDGTPGSGDMPGRMVFSVTPDASATPAEALRISNNKAVNHNTSTIVIDASSHLGLRSYTVATLPSAAVAARLIYVSDGTSNKRLAVSDATNWRFPDGAVVT